MNTSTFSHFWVLWVRTSTKLAERKHFLLWNMHGVFSTKYVTATVSVFRDLSFMKNACCCETSKQPNFSSIRAKSKQWEINSSSLRCIWFPKKTYTTLNEVESGGFLSHILELSMRTHKAEPQATINQKSVALTLKIH